MKTSQSAYVDFSRFVLTGQNRELLANTAWQRNVEFLATSLTKYHALRLKVIKPAKRR